MLRIEKIIKNNDIEYFLKNLQVVTSHNHVAFRQVLEKSNKNNKNNNNNKAVSKTAFAMHAVKKWNVKTREAACLKTMPLSAPVLPQYTPNSSPHFFN